MPEPTFMIQNSFDREMAAMPAAKPRSDVGFGKMFESSLELGIMEENSLASIVHGDVQKANNAKIMQLYKAGMISEDEIQFYSNRGTLAAPTIDWDELADYLAYQRPELGIMSNADINNRLRDRYRAAKQKNSDLLRTATIGGQAGHAVGTMSAIVTDPFIMGSMLVGVPGTSQALGWLSRFARGAGGAALRIGPAEALAEVGRQYSVYSFKSDIGVEYDFEQAFKSVLTGVGVAVGLGSTVAGLSAALRGPAQALTKIDDPAAKAAKSNIDQTRRELDQFPEDADAKQALSSVEDEVQYQEAAPAYSKDIDEAATPEQLAKVEESEELDRVRQEMKLEGGDALSEKELETQARLQYIKEGDYKAYIDKRVAAVAPEKRAREAKLAAQDYVARFTTRSGIVPLEARAITLSRRYMAKLEPLINKFRVRKFGLWWDKAGQENIVREIFETGSSGDEDLKAYGSAIKAVFKEIMDDFNTAGGEIKALEDFNIPMRHDPTKIRRAGDAEWKRRVRDLIDLERLSFNRTLSDKQQEKLLDEVFKGITSDGAHRFDFKGFNPYARKAIGKYHQEHRILHFKDAESWLTYANQYGPQRPVQAVLDYVDMMAREIASMQKFGPNPDHTIKKISEYVKSIAGTKPGRLSTAYSMVRGRGLTDNVKTADIMQTIRNISAIPKLGMAAISALGDETFMALGSKMNDMPIMKTILRGIRNLSPTAEGDRRTLMQIGLGTEYAFDRLKTGTRISAATGYGKAARMLDVVIRASGLNHYTYANKHAFGFEWISNLTRMVDEVPWEKIKPLTRDNLASYGIEKADWDRLKSVKRIKKQGLDLIDLTTEKDIDFSSKWISAWHYETTLAVPEPDVFVRSTMLQGTEAGTMSGEFMRFTGQLKAFPVSIMMLHGRRAYDLGAASGSAYALGMVMGMTSLGILSYTAKEILKGRTPVTDPKELFIAGLQQGGSLGLLGDILLSDPNRTGAAYGNMVGPAVADADLAVRALLQLPVDPAKGARRVLKFGQRMTPGQMWQTKLLMERYAFDWMNRASDPDWFSKQLATKRKMRKDRGQEYWWQPGDMTP